MALVGLFPVNFSHLSKETIFSCYEEQEKTIGKNDFGNEADVLLDIMDDSVSRIHLCLKMNKGKCQIKDISEFGTFLKVGNKEYKPIEKEKYVEIPDKSHIRIGKFHILKIYFETATCRKCTKEYLKHHRSRCPYCNSKAEKSLVYEKKEMMCLPTRELAEIAPVYDIRKECKDKTVVIVGDIHGCFDEFQELLYKIGWNPKTNIIIHTGDLIDRGPKIRETLEFAMNPANNMYSLMSNHEYNLLKYLRGSPAKPSLGKTIYQIRESLKQPFLLDWLESLPYIIRWSEDCYVVHAGIAPQVSINRQKKETCIYVRAWNPLTQKMSKERERDKPWYTFTHNEDIKIFFGHQIHCFSWISPYAVAMDGGVAFGNTLRACINGKKIIEVQSISRRDTVSVSDMSQ